MASGDVSAGGGGWRKKEKMIRTWRRSVATSKPGRRKAFGDMRLEVKEQYLRIRELDFIAKLCASGEGNGMPI